MRFIDLDEGQRKFLSAYMALPQEKKRFVEYIIRIGASKILSDEEFTDFLLMLKEAKT